MARKKSAIKRLENLYQCRDILIEAQQNWERMCEEKPKKLIKKIKTKTDSLIYDWYDSYERRYYDPKESLMDAYKINRDGIEVWMDFSPSFMTTKHHQSNEIIFNNSFLEGWHGGSMGTDQNDEEADVPMWRRPMPKKGIENPYNHWYTEAARSESPYQRIMNELPSIFEEDENEWRTDTKKYVINPLSKILKQVRK